MAIYNLEPKQKSFYYASMMVQLEEEQKQAKEREKAMKRQTQTGI